MPGMKVKDMDMGYSKDDDLDSPDSLPESQRPPLRHIDKYVRPECPCLSTRYTVAVLACVGFIILFGMRCNMGMAKLQASNGNGPFNWRVSVESAVDNSFFWGYLITQVPGGFLASMYPANRIFGTAIAISSFLNLLIPGAAESSPALIIIVRICQGFVEAGLVGALPHLLMTVVVPSGGLLADYVRKNGYLTTTNVRKVFNCGGFGMEALFFVVVAFAKDAQTAIVALTLGVAFSGFAISGFNVNHLDIAPRYASILMGMSNGFGTIAGFICPIAVDNIVRTRSDRDPEDDPWMTVFIMAATVHFFGVTFYALFASGELQPWAEPPPSEKVAPNVIEEALQAEGGPPIRPPKGSNL